MDQTLSYASRVMDRRWSHMAFWAIGLSLVQIPVFFGICCLFSHSSLNPAFEIIAILGSLFVPDVIVAALGLNVCFRSWFSRGTLRGGWLGAVALLIAGAWPVGLIAWVVTHLPAC